MVSNVPCVILQNGGTEISLRAHNFRLHHHFDSFAIRTTKMLQTMRGQSRRNDALQCTKNTKRVIHLEWWLMPVNNAHAIQILRVGMHLRVCSCRRLEWTMPCSNDQGWTQCSGARKALRCLSFGLRTSTMQDVVFRITNLQGRKHGALRKIFSTALLSRTFLQHATSRVDRGVLYRASYGQLVTYWIVACTYSGLPEWVFCLLNQGTSRFCSIRAPGYTNDSYRRKIPFFPDHLDFCSSDGLVKLAEMNRQRRTSSLGFGSVWIS